MDALSIHIVILLCSCLSCFVVCARVCLSAVLKCCVALLLVDDFPLAGQARMPWAVEMEALFILSLQHYTLITTQHYSVATKLYTYTLITTQHYTVATTLYSDHHTTRYIYRYNVVATVYTVRLLYSTLHFYTVLVSACSSGLLEHQSSPLRAEQQQQPLDHNMAACYLHFKVWYRSQ